MSVERCEKHSRHYDTDFELECPICVAHNTCPYCGEDDCEKHQEGLP